MSSAVAKLPKPVLKGFARSSLKYVIASVGVSGVTVWSAMYYFFTRPRREAISEFYKNYDAEAAFEQMRKRGIFRSC